jgi:steroid 5-alpha reductase family enzyme
VDINRHSTPHFASYHFCLLVPFTEPLITGESKYPFKLLGFWTAQSLWAFIGVLPVTAAQALGAASIPIRALRFTSILALTMTAAGFAIESVADHQKSAFKDENGPNAFITTGLYRYCRFPNYFGEILTWSSLTVFAGLNGVFLSAPWIVLSPLFTTFLLTSASGVPATVAGQEKKYGHIKEYREYADSTNLIVPDMFKFLTSDKKKGGSGGEF